MRRRNAELARALVDELARTFISNTELDSNDGARLQEKKSADR
jgi:hypothetical protein